MLVGIGMTKGELVPPRALIRLTRRHRPIEQMRRIVEETVARGASIAQVASEHVGIQNRPLATCVCTIELLPGSSTPVGLAKPRSR